MQLIGALAVSAVCITGCRTARPGDDPIQQPASQSREAGLGAGALLLITFPDAPDWGGFQEVTTDGMITLPMGQKLNVLGMAPSVVVNEVQNLYPSHRGVKVELAGSTAAITGEKAAAGAAVPEPGPAAVSKEPAAAATEPVAALPPAAAAVIQPATGLSLREGDVLRVSFPGAPDLNTTQPIRRDGVITLPMVGEVKAAGLTPADLQKELVRLYSPKLVSKEVNVSLESSTFPVFVTGAVLRPGRLSADRPLTALEAIMEAGGFDYTRANLKAVRIIRREQERLVNYTVNLKVVLQGRQNDPFVLKPMDIVYVPEKFSWF